MTRHDTRAALAAAAVLLIVLPSAHSGTGQAPPGKKLTYEQAFLDKPPLLKRIDGFPQQESREWLDDRHFLVHDRNEESSERNLIRVDALTGKRDVLLDFSALKKNMPAGFPAARPVQHTDDWNGLLYDHGKDLYVYWVKEARLVRITEDPGEEKNPRLSPDGRWAAYTRDNDLFVSSTGDGREIRLTNDGGELVYNGWASWVYFEEILGRASRYAAFWWSPDGTKIAFLRFDDNPVPEFPIFDAEGPHGRLERQRYPKAGDPNPKVRLGIASVPEAKVVWADFDENADDYLAWPFWLPDSSRLAVQWMNRGQDHIKIFFVDPATGGKSVLYEEKQTAWVEFFEDLHFFRDGRGFLLRSDRDGRRHLYLHGLDGRLLARLTSGDWDVQGIVLINDKKGYVCFTANRGASEETHLFRVGLDGTKLVQLTREPGVHRPNFSPGGSFFLDRHSGIDRPARIDLRRADGSLVRAIEDSRTPEFAEYALGRVELFSIPTSDGWSLPAQWILPPGFDPARKYPVLFTVYGGPASPRVSNSFPPLSSFYLAQEGIIVLTVDHRGAGHHGKKGTSLMHRSLGKWEIHDWIEAVKWLREKPFIDSARVGITGGSYGGYATCLALTSAADYFTHGFARASVTDWRLYDSVYTERYMDAPAENPEGYKNGSVMTHAPKLKGALFIEHGALDDNVHAQNSIQLIDRLIDLDKDFSFMLLPKQRHGSLGKKREFSNRRYVEFWFRHFLGR
jgi:dipeptidyl-peptidase-4